MQDFSRFRRRDAAADTGLQAFTRDFPTISLKGREFMLTDTTGEKTVIDSRTLDVIIVDALPAVGRKFYEAAFSPDNPAPPACWSNDGRVPAANVPSPQHSACATCPQSAAGSGRDGKSAACSFIKPLVMYLADDKSDKPILYRLDLKGMSLFGGRQAAGYLPWLGSKGVKGYVAALYEGPMADWPDEVKHMSNAITQLRFSEESVPSLGFKYVSDVEDFDLDYMATLKIEDYQRMFEVTTAGELAMVGRALPGPDTSRRALPQSSEPAPAAAQTRAAPAPAAAQTRAAPAPAAEQATGGRRGRTQAAGEAQPAATRSRRASEPEILPPEPARTSRRGGQPAVSSKIDPAVIEGDPSIDDISDAIAGLKG